MDFIEQFTLDLQHRKGASHNNADALSRRPCERQGDACRQCSGRSDNREDSAETRDGIPTENQSSEGPEVPRDVPPEMHRRGVACRGPTIPAMSVEAKRVFLAAGVLCTKLCYTF